MNLIVSIIITFLTTNLVADVVNYKSVDDEKDDYQIIEYPDDCDKLIEISKSNLYQFKDESNAEDTIKRCKIFAKGKSFKKTVKSKTNSVTEAVSETGSKVKDGLIKGTGAIANSASKEVGLILEDSKKLTGGIIEGSGNVINSTIEKGSKITNGFSSFIKGIFSSDN